MSLVQQYIESRHWAILEDYLALMVAIAERDAEGAGDTLDAIQRRLGSPIPGTSEATVRDGVAIIPVVGPMFRYANLFTEISGATSYERLAADIGRVMSSRDVRHVIYDINSPGGEVDGAGEVADLIAGFRGKKPQTAYISHLGASAAYWLAAATDNVYISESGMAGSIGAVLGVSQRRSRAGVETLEFVSSFSPDKRLDPFSEDADEAQRARAKLQALVDKIGTVFAEAVASLRDTAVEDIMATKGGLFVGTDAVGVGLADGVGTLEQLVTAFANGAEGSGAPKRLVALDGLETSDEGHEMSQDGTKTEPVIDREFLASNHPDLVAAIKAEGAEAERSRILAIHDLDAQGFDAVKREAMGNPEATSGTAAEAILTAKGEQEKRRAQSVKDALDADEGDLGDLAATKTPPDEGETEDQAAASILKWMPTAQQVAVTD